MGVCFGRSLAGCPLTCVSPSIHQSISPSVHQSVSPSVHQSISPSVRQSVSPSVRQSVSPAPTHHCTNVHHRMIKRYQYYHYDHFALVARCGVDAYLSMSDNMPAI